MPRLHCCALTTASEAWPTCAWTVSTIASNRCDSRLMCVRSVKVSQPRMRI